MAATKASSRACRSFTAERLEATGAAPTITAPTNRDAHRDRRGRPRRAAQCSGCSAPDITSIRATDGERNFTLRLARGDRVRLFRSTGAKYATGRGGAIGRNGSVLEVVDADEHGITLRSKHGKVGTVRWADIAEPAGPRSACLRIRDDDPHGAGLDDARAYQRTTVRQPGHRWAARLFRAHTAPDEGIPYYQRRGRADRGAQAARTERYARHHRRRQVGTGGARAQLPAREGQRSVHVRSRGSLSRGTVRTFHDMLPPNVARQNSRSTDLGP